MDFITQVFSWPPPINPSPLDALVPVIIGYLPSVARAIGVLILGFVIYKLTAAPLRRLLVRSNIEAWLARIIAFNVYKFFVVLITIVTALGHLGVNVGAALTGIGILGIAIGFIAQDSVANIVAGFLISIDKPFRVGDYITIDKYYGRIQQITMRSTRIRTQDNTYVVIPNSKIINEVMVDHTANGDTRVNVPVCIEYEASIQEARDVILSAVKTIEGVLTEPAPDVVVNSLGESGVELMVRVWISDSALERHIYFRTGEVIKEALDAAHLKIAYPHLELVGTKKIR